MTRLWMRVQQIVDECANRIMDEVKDIARTLDRLKRTEFERIARRYNVIMFLVVERSDENPLLTIPVLYVKLLKTHKWATYWRQVTHVVGFIEQDIKFWASDYRLAVRALPPTGEQYLKNIIAVYGGGGSGEEGSHIA